MNRRWDVEEAAGDAEVFGAAAGLEVRVGVLDCADGGEDRVQVFGQGQGEEVVEVGDLVADGARGEAGGGGEVPQCDADAAVGGEDAGGGFQDVGTALAIPLGGAGAAWAGFGLVAHEAGWDGVHGGGE